MIPKGVFVLYYFVCGVITGVALSIIYQHLKKSWFESQAIKAKAKDIGGN